MLIFSTFQTRVSVRGFLFDWSCLQNENSSKINWTHCLEWLMEIESGTKLWDSLIYCLFGQKRGKSHRRQLSWWPRSMMLTQNVRDQGIEFFCLSKSTVTRQLSYLWRLNSVEGCCSAVTSPLLQVAKYLCSSLTILRHHKQPTIIHIWVWKVKKKKINCNSYNKRFWRSLTSTWGYTPPY